MLFAPDVFCAVDNVRHNGTCGREFARALAVKHDVADCVTAHQNGVEHVADGGKLAAVHHDGGADHCGNLAVVKPFCASEQFNHAAVIADISNVFQSDFGNAFGVDAVGVNVFAEAKRRQNANFAAGVLPFDIGGRVFSA